MMKRISILTAVFLIGLGSMVPARAITPRQTKAGTAVIPLQDIIGAVVQSLRDYQNQANGTTQPTLSSAEFDFKTVVDTTVQAGVSFWIIVIKPSQTKEIVTDTDFTYQLPSPEKPGANLTAHTIPLEDALAKTISQAAAAVAANPSLSVGGKIYNMCKLTTTVSFGVKTDLNGQVSFPLSLITVSASVDHSDNNTQQVKLTFDSKNAACHGSLTGALRNLIPGQH